MENVFEAKGLLSYAGEIQEFGEKSLKKRTFVVNITNDKFPYQIAFDLLGDQKVTLIDNIKTGTEIFVKFDIKARNWNGRWYNSLTAYFVTPAATLNAPQQTNTTTTQTVQTINELYDNNEELPF